MGRTKPNLDDPRVKQRADKLRDAKRQLVVEAARRVFETNGLDGASIRLIAAEAGCTTGAIYPYFKGKEEIYAALLSDSLEALAVYMAARVKREKAVLARARAAVESFYLYYQANPSELSLGLYLFREPGVQPAGLNPQLDRALNAKLGEAFSIIVRAIDEAGFDRPRDRAADGISHAVGVLIMVQTGRMNLFRAKPDHLMRTYLEAVLPA